MTSLRFLMTALALASALAGTAASPAGSPVPNGTGNLNPADRDLTVRPGDDFFQYAGGTWLRNNPIPADQRSWGTWSLLAEKNLDQMKAILEVAATDTQAAEGSNTRKLGDFYASGMDEKKIDADGLKPLEEEFAAIRKIRDAASLQKAIESFHLKGLFLVFGFTAEKDQSGPDRVIPWIAQGGTGLPERDYYLDESERAVKLREEYVRHIARMFELAGDKPEAATTAALKVLEMETRLARASFSIEELRVPANLDHKMKPADLTKFSGAFDCGRYLAALGLPAEQTVNVVPAKYFSELGKMMKDQPVADWKTYLRWHVLHEAAPYLPSVFDQENFRFYSTVLSGVQQQKPRWKRVLETTSACLRDILGQEFVTRHFPPEAKAKALELVENLRAAFRGRLEKVEWMSDATRARALGKLGSFGVKIGYPDKWKDYSTLKVARDSYVRNVIRAQEFALREKLAKVGKPADRTEWDMGPQEINAYYHPLFNEIVFPAAILQPPFFDFKADDAVNYGGIGAVIGHEMTHGFDDSGRHYDKNGQLTDWWAKEDEERFKARTEVLVKQVDQYKVAADVHVNGTLTLGENLGDLGGLLLSYDALQAALKKNPAPERIDGFTPAQRFFLSWARVWRTNTRSEMLVLQVKTDPHPPAMFRVNGPFSNLQAFFDAFEIKEGDKLFRPEADRVKIW